MKMQSMGTQEPKDLWTHIDEAGPPPINAPALLVFVGEERADESGIELTYGWRTEEGYYDRVEDKILPPHYTVLGYFLAPKWRIN
jgi:hypothetical protein